VAAPTASLHFDNQDLAGLSLAKITLHVGAGTFLPVRTERLDQHQMHFETVEISAQVEAQVRACEGRVWALGTTAARALESMDRLARTKEGLRGETNLFIYPPYRFRDVDVLLTNFHQPRSTLLALVAAFAGLQEVKDTYAWAIARGFKLFSYGDLSAWTREP
jgi:S-adenosylmethionine:tRNA ribosyltransferase-isomerase